MTTLRTAAQQALEALEKYQQMMLAEAGCRWGGGDAAITALRAALAQEQAEPVQEPTPGEYHGWVLREVLFDRGEPVGHREPAQEPVQEPVAWMHPHKPDQICLSPQDGWLELIIAPPKAEPVQEPQTLDDAMRLPRAMAQAYESGYKAGAAAERERIIQFLQEMQRVVGDAHNHYGVAAVRIKEGV